MIGVRHRRRASAGTSLLLLGAVLFASGCWAPRAHAYIYWSSGSIGRANQDGSHVTGSLIHLGSHQFAYAAAVGSHEVYFAWAPDSYSAGGIGEARLNGAHVEKTLITIPADFSGETQIAVNRAKSTG